MKRIWSGGVAAMVLLLGSSAGAAEKRAEAPQAERPQPAPSPSPEVQSPEEVPLEPILVQGYVKSVSKEQLTLTAPGAPVDLPLSLHEETRYIQGENDVKRESVHEGPLGRAALLPLGEDLVALVVAVVPSEEAAPGAGPDAEASPKPEGNGLQGAEPKAQPPAVTPEPPSPDSAEPKPLEPAPKGDTTEL